MDNNGGCHQDADCNNTIGSYSCECKPGYFSDGMECTGMSWELILISDVCIHSAFISKQRGMQLLALESS